MGELGGGGDGGGWWEWGDGGDRGMGGRGAVYVHGSLCSMQIFFPMC